MKKFLVDTLALNLFIIITAFFVEVVFSGITWSIFWKGRIIMIIPNIITVQPYNWTRIWLGRRLGVWKSERFHQIVRDTVVFIIYRVPLVFIVLTILGATQEKVITACIVATLISGFTGRPYGIFLDWMRKIFKVS
ncbi:MAG: L-alanine exporter AlaE [Parcubacteria group bacterium]